MYNIKLIILAGLFALSFSAQAKTVIEDMTLPQVYSLSMAEVENIVFEKDKEICEGLLSVAVQGKTDPAKLTPAQFCAVQNYSGSRFELNKPLWLTGPDGSLLSGFDWAYVRVLDAALAKIPNAPAATVYRGTSQEVLKLPPVGQVLRLKGYTSTSPSFEAAEGFIRDRLMIINIRSGKNIKIYSNSGSEDEFLLPRSTLVRVDKIETKTMDLFSEETGPEQREVEVVYLTEVDK